jgi:uncharacterized protein (TIGR02118 family)
MMAQRVFFLNRLREGVEPAAYEKWVREVDYPLARSLPAINSYVVTRLDGLVTEEGEAPYDHLEVVEITSIEEYRAALSGGPEVEAFFKEWSSYVGESVAVYGEVIE